MKKIMILSGSDERLQEQFSHITGYEVLFTEKETFLPDIACVLISQDFAGKKAGDICTLFTQRNIPNAEVTFDGSEENQILLLDRGISHYLILPMSSRLLSKRIAALIGEADRRDSGTGFELFSQLAKADTHMGAYVVRESDFANIYRFVLRLQERMDKQAQLVCFSFHSRLKGPLEPGVLEEAFPIVQRCLRRGDIVSIYEQRIYAVLMGADEAGGRTASDRIVNTYHAHCCDSMYDMVYEMAEIE